MKDINMNEEDNYR